MKKIFFLIVATLIVAVVSIPSPCGGEFNLPIHGKIYYAVASWYGPEFHGKTTASGKIFNMHDFTCAHRTLPFGSWLKITNIVNNKSTFCVVNDRGPFEIFRGLDLSFAAAKVLDMISPGICAVRIEYLGVESIYHKTLKYFFYNPLFIKYFSE